MSTHHHHQKQFEQAIIIGGSMAGLFTARVLSDHFAKVTVLERDILPEAPIARKGIPQARHAHVLLTRGQRILSQLFPGIETELSAAGALRVDWGLEAQLFSVTGWVTPRPSDLVSYACSRDLLEWLVRQRVRALSNVEFVSEARVGRLLSTPDHKRILGVELEAAVGQKLGQKQSMTADLVVDASGRTSKLPEWLQQMGFAQPSESVVSSSLGYATRWYEIPDDFAGEWRAMLIAARPPQQTRGGLVLVAEHNRWLVTLSGYNADYPPTDEDGFLAFTRSLASPAIYEAIKHAKAITPVYGYQRTENRRRHYEALTLPDGVVALGDAVCAFNPVYGQGMTMGGLAALELDRCLKIADKKSTLAGITPIFQKRLAKVNDIAWMLATGEDFRWPSTVGERSKLMALTHGYLGELQKMFASDPEVSYLFWSVAHLITPPTAMFAPKMVAKVVRQWLRSKWQHPSAETEQAQLHSKLSGNS